MTKKNGIFNTGIKSTTKWKDVDWSQYQLAAWYRWYKENWEDVKLILLHKNCPQKIRERYINSSVWWKRIPALLCKHVRHKYWHRAVKDSHRFVRKCAYNGHYYGIKEGYQIPKIEVLELMEKDKEAQWDSRVKNVVKKYKKLKRKSIQKFKEEFYKDVELMLTSPNDKERHLAAETYKILKDSDLSDKEKKTKIMELWV